MSQNELSGTILCVEDEEFIRQLIAVKLRRSGYSVVLAGNGEDALAYLGEAIPDLILLDVMMPGMDGFEVLKRLRDDTTTKMIPVIMLTARGSVQDKITGLGLGADDYLVKPFEMDELLARVRAKLARPSVPRENLSRDLQTGLLSEHLWTDEVKREVIRIARGGSVGALAYMYVNELPRLREEFGARVEAEIAKQLAAIIRTEVRPLDLVGRDAKGYFALLFPEIDIAAARRHLSTLSHRIAENDFTVKDEILRLTPTVGFTTLKQGVSFEQARKQARLALTTYAAVQLDLEPRLYNLGVETFAQRQIGTTPAAPRQTWWSGWQSRLRLPLQIAITSIASMVIPFLIYYWLDQSGHDITPLMYIVVVIALLFTALVIWVEGLFATRARHPPEQPGAPYPPAAAVIAAYLPNEAATISETVKAFLQIQYPAPLQIILAYNTPRNLPIEKTLLEIARQEPRFQLLRVEGSNSKAQNINAALSEVRGVFVGVFDADHHPQPDSFTRAWRWLSSGYDVVQGHCVIRNGDASWVARMTAVEFEAIYAVSHPGRNRLHDFGIFGGSNGYWKKEILQTTRMHGFMLTEDIDSSMRITEAGYKIISDPFLVSRELAPATLGALWNQRMRWAQGWFQVSLEHLLQAMRSKKLTPRQKLGVFYLLGWREIYPWLSVQMFPIIAFWVLKYGGQDRLDWLIPIFVLTTLFTLSVGPGQTVLAYRLAVPEIRKHKRWFWFYLLMGSLFYTEFKNVIARVAQIKEFMGERSWRITPRTQERQVRQ